MAGAVKLESYTVAQSHLRKFVNELEAIEAERAELKKRARDIRKRASGQGYDLPALATTLRLRATSSERRAVIDLYLAALGIEMPNVSTKRGGR